MNIINSQRQKDKTYREQLLIFNSVQRNSPQNTRGGTTAIRPRPLTSQSAHSTAFNSFLNPSDYFQYAGYTGRREARGLFILGERGYMDWFYWDRVGGASQSPLI